MAIKRGVSLYSYQQTQFFKKLDWKGQIREVTLSSDTIKITPKSEGILTQERTYYATALEDATALTERLEGTGIIFKAEARDMLSEFVMTLLSVLLPAFL